MGNPLVEIDALPEPLRHRARYSVAAVQAYGGKLESLVVRRCGGAVHCILHFDYETIQFIAAIPAPAQEQHFAAPRTSLPDKKPRPERSALHK
jgi:hypothetical protein